MYVSYYTRDMMSDVDNSSIGIVLCTDKSVAVVKYFLSKNMLYLPTEEEIKNKYYRVVIRGCNVHKIVCEN